jgi:hypothetical protein
MHVVTKPLHRKCLEIKLFGGAPDVSMSLNVSQRRRRLLDEPERVT